MLAFELFLNLLIALFLAFLLHQDLLLIYLNWRLSESLVGRPGNGTSHHGTARCTCPSAEAASDTSMMRAWSGSLPSLSGARQC